MGGSTALGLRSIISFGKQRSLPIRFFQLQRNVRIRYNLDKLSWVRSSNFKFNANPQPTTNEMHARFFSTKEERRRRMKYGRTDRTDDHDGIFRTDK